MQIIGKVGGFSSISAAISSFGDHQSCQPLYLLREGTYQENLSINIAHLRVVGESVQRTILDLTADEKRPACQLKISADDVELEHLLIKFDRADQIQIAGKRCFLHDCRILCGDHESSPDTDPSLSKLLPTWWFCGNGCLNEIAPAIAHAMQEKVWVQCMGKADDDAYSFLSGGHLGEVELCLRKDDKLFVGFSPAEGNPFRTSSGYLSSVFPLCLDMFVDAARRYGAEPVLMIPAGNSSPAYAEVIRQHAFSRGVRSIDLSDCVSKDAASLFRHFQSAWNAGEALRHSSSASIETES